MDLRHHIRRYVRVSVGNGRNTNAWEDSWLHCGPLSAHVSYRKLCGNGLDHSANVHDMIDVIGNVWPSEWVNRYPNLSNVVVPTLGSTSDLVECRDSLGVSLPFSASTVWSSLIGPYQTVGWHKVVWFRGAIPKHVLCIWQAYHCRLPTQDRILAWKHEPPDHRCPFCGDCPDSHSHLFFSCTFPLQVWRILKDEAHMIGFPDSWRHIMDQMANGVPNSFTQKLTLSASVYFIWQERNFRLFRKRRRTVDEVVKVIKETILLRIAWKRKKD